MARTASINRALPAVMAIAVGMALRISSLLWELKAAMFYLRPALIKERDERERRTLAKKFKEENNGNSSTMRGQ